MHTILGANGTIGRELSRCLAETGNTIRQVSRTPQRVNPADDVFAADLLDSKATAEAIAGSEVAYLVAGLKYDTAVWRQQWPRIMRNVIDGCKQHGSRLVFFDNVYAYGRVDGVMTEETPFNPVSRKGEAGKTPQWLGNPKAVHTFTYTPDAGRATAMLGQSPEACGQTWHLPTSRESMIGERFVHLACELAGRPYKLQVAPRWMLRLMGLFVPVLRENDEMMYQFEYDYRFDSRKIEAGYGLEATPYRIGIAETLAA